MRIVLLGASLIALAGCATVSMRTGEAVVEAGLSEQQTALRAHSDAYCQTVDSAGWVSPGLTLSGLASLLMDGSTGGVQAGPDYGERLAGMADASEALSILAGDARTARSGLDRVIDEADRLLRADPAPSRGDVMSFERALMKAQRSHRAFLAAEAQVNGAAPAARETVTDEIARLADRIDAARILADDLAARYTRTDGSAA